MIISGHHYLVEVEHRKDWEAWADLDEEDYVSWVAPSYAFRINGSISWLEFSLPSNIRLKEGCVDIQ